MSRAKALVLCCTVSMAVILCVLLGCKTKSSKDEMQVEKPIAVTTPQPVAQKTAEPAAKLPPPTMAEVEAAFHRVFGEALTAERSATPVYLVGDFNGDESEDLAVIARPAPGKLDDVNNELANWTVQDADKAFLPPPGKSVVVLPKGASAKVENSEEIMAIIHGFGPQGWRNPDARQAYIVKHAPAALQGIASSASQSAIRAMHLPVKTDIIEGVRQKKQGFVFWTGGVYAWHPQGT